MLTNLSTNRGVASRVFGIGAFGFGAFGIGVFGFYGFLGFCG